MHKFFDDRRQVELGEVGNEAVDPPGDQPNVTLLLQEIDAEPPGIAVDVDHVGEVDAAGFVEDLLPPRVENRLAEPHDFGVVDRAAVHRPQRAMDAHIRGPADLEMQIASFQFDHGPKQLVDFQLVPSLKKRCSIADAWAASSLLTPCAFMMMSS